MSTITRLPASSARALTAGQLINSLHAVVQELVDNALDAGASAVTVAISADHRDISVRDNGRGVAVANLPLLGERHCTSKLRALEDLQCHSVPSSSSSSSSTCTDFTGTAFATAGFRGEALHLLSQVADVTITTRTADQEVPLSTHLAFNCISPRQDRVPFPCHDWSNLVSISDLFFLCAQIARSPRACALSTARASPRSRVAPRRRAPPCASRVSLTRCPCARVCTPTRTAATLICASCTAR
jgi:DNA mismatch repair protein MutL